jgi:toxin HigB-1
MTGAVAAVKPVATSPRRNGGSYTFDVLLDAVYHRLMIRSFRDRATETLWMGAFVKRFSGIEKQALRKLDMLHQARDLNDLRVPPANRLEALAGNRRGQHSIRINDQWRICFTWTKEGPANVEIVDYH